MKSPLRLFIALLLAPLVALHAAEPVTPPGDRNLTINQVYPPEAFYHNGKGGRVLDVTKPPFNAKGDGKTDDSQALCDAMRFVGDHYEDLAGEGYSYCGYKFERNWLIYLPNGEYFVSHTISQGWPARAYDIKRGWANCGRVAVASPEEETPELELRGERNYGIRVVGQSRKGTVIRLKDQCPRFEKGKENALLRVRQLDNEYYIVEVAFKHSDPWILGYKGEMATASGTFFHASDQSRLELLGGLYHVRNGQSSLPLVVSIDSEVALSLNAFGGTKLNVPVQSVILRDERKGQVTEVTDNRFEQRRAIAPGEKIISLLTNTPK